MILRVDEWTSLSANAGTLPTERETSVLDVPDDGDSDSEKERLS